MMTLYLVTRRGEVPIRYSVEYYVNADIAISDKFSVSELATDEVFVSDNVHESTLVFNRIDAMLSKIGVPHRSVCTADD